nr:heme-binding protein 1-like [Procambarus clarkii]XP_045607452.1 heme-binding protein 1-like [Procambarus clarkii]
MKGTHVTWVLLLVQLATSQAKVEAEESAPYQVIKTEEGFEERLYPPTKWVCYDDVDQVYTSKSQTKAFLSLFRYITGANDQGVSMAMTAPVTMLRQELKDSMTRYQMCFYLPKARQGTPPSPTDEGVYIEERPAITVLTRTIGGFITRETQWENEASALQEVLQAAGENIDFSFYYRAGYDSPMKFENRRNEIWFLKK